MIGIRTIGVGVVGALCGVCGLAGAAGAGPGELVFGRVGAIGLGGVGAAEVVVHDAVRARFLVTNAAAGRVEVLTLDWAGDGDGRFARGELIEVGGGLNSVAVNPDASARMVVGFVGWVVLFLGAWRGLLLYGLVRVGWSVVVPALPDMVTFTPDGTRVVVACEGEPEGGVDPAGAVAVIDVVGPFVAEPTMRVATIGDVSIEPEYVAITADGARAVVTCQEASALAVVDLDEVVLARVDALPAVDYAAAGEKLEGSDRDGGRDGEVGGRVWPVLGMRQPDTVVRVDVGGATYFLTADEGDPREGEDVRVKDLELDSSVFGDVEALRRDDAIGRLQVSRLRGDVDGDGDFDELHAFGGRRMSVWDRDGGFVADTGDLFERVIAERVGERDGGRDDNRGPEPEALCVGVVGGRAIAFVGMERQPVVVAVDISEPGRPMFAGLVETLPHVGVETLVFVGDEAGGGMVVGAFEGSGSVAAFSVRAGE